MPCWRTTSIRIDLSQYADLEAMAEALQENKLWFAHGAIKDTLAHLQKLKDKGLAVKVPENKQAAVMQAYGRRVVIKAAVSRGYKYSVHPENKNKVRVFK